MLNDKEVTVSASDLIKSVRDNCSTMFDLNDARIEAFSLKGSLPTPVLPTTQSITFKCPDIGLYVIRIWVKDETGNWAYSESFIDLQDNSLFCK